MIDKPKSTGSIFTNRFKEKETQPDWTGKVEFNRDLLKQLVNVVKEGGDLEVRIALWDRTSKNGNDYKYLCMDLQESKDRPQATETVKPQEAKSDGFEEDLPF
jgi:hypothetical protein|tara:strand:+ start:32 stop:340 length:309 start_codon:yes stop_codon:yes gene_type:complete